jgi:hypothetical protein
MMASHHVFVGIDVSKGRLSYTGREVLPMRGSIQALQPEAECLL